MVFRKIKLSEIASVQTGPFGSQLHKEDYVEDGIPIITVEHLGENKILHQNLPLVGDEDYNRLAKYHLQKNDIVFSRVGSVDRRALVSEKEDGWMFSGRCLRVRVSDSEVNPIYLSYYFGTSSFKEYIRSIAVGATMPSINTKILSDIEVVLPSLEIQNKVSQVLNQLDSKIWLNEEIINKLEGVCSLLFKRWFIDFEFPNEQGLPYRTSGGEMLESELGKIPESYNIDSLSYIAEIIMGQSPKGTSYNFDFEGLPLINGASDFKGGEISPIKYTTEPKKISKKGDYIFGVRATLGNVTETHQEYAIGRGAGIARSKERHLKEFLYFQLVKAFNTFEHTASGSVYLNISKNDLNDFKIVLPPKDIIQKFHEITSPILEKKELLIQENIRLRSIRDTLLPKLLSGEIEIPDESVVESS